MRLASRSSGDGISKIAQVIAESPFVKNAPRKFTQVKFFLRFNALHVSKKWRKTKFYKLLILNENTSQIQDSIIQIFV